MSVSSGHEGGEGEAAILKLSLRSKNLTGANLFLLTKSQGLINILKSLDELNKNQRRRDYEDSLRLLERLLVKYLRYYDEIERFVQEAIARLPHHHQDRRFIKQIVSISLRCLSKLLEVIHESDRHLDESDDARLANLKERILKETSKIFNSMRKSKGFIYDKVPPNSPISTGAGAASVTNDDYLGSLTHHSSRPVGAQLGSGHHFDQLSQSISLASSSAANAAMIVNHNRNQYQYYHSQNHNHNHHHQQQKAPSPLPVQHNQPRHSTSTASQSIDEDRLSIIQQAISPSSHVTADEAIVQAVKNSCIPLVQYMLTKNLITQKQSSWNYITTKCLRMVLEALADMQLNVAEDILKQIGQDVNLTLRDIFYQTTDTELRVYLKKVLQRRQIITQHDIELSDLIDMVLATSAQDNASQTSTTTTTTTSSAITSIKSGLQTTSNIPTLSIDSMRSQDDYDRCKIFHSVLKSSHANVKAKCRKLVKPDILWRYLVDSNDEKFLITWLKRNSTFKEICYNDFPYGWRISQEMVDYADEATTSSEIKSSLLNLATASGLITTRELANFNLVLSRLSRASLEMCKDADLRLMILEGRRDHVTSLPGSSIKYEKFQQQLMEHLLHYNLDVLYWYLEDCTRDSFSLTIETIKQYNPSSPKARQILNLLILILTWSRFTPAQHNTKYYDYLMKIMMHISDLNENDTTQFTPSQNYLKPPSSEGNAVNMDMNVFYDRQQWELGCIMYMHAIDRRDQHEIINADRFFEFLHKHYPLLSDAFSTTFHCLPKSDALSLKLEPAPNMYDLLESAGLPFKLSELFNWQQKWSNQPSAYSGSHDQNRFTELPHFCHPKLVSLYGLRANLTYGFYLTLGRPLQAYQSFKSEILVNLSSTPSTPTGQTNPMKMLARTSSLSAKTSPRVRSNRSSITNSSATPKIHGSDKIFSSASDLQPDNESKQSAIDHALRKAFILACFNSQDLRIISSCVIFQELLRSGSSKQLRLHLAVADLINNYAINFIALTPREQQRTLGHLLRRATDNLSNENIRAASKLLQLLVTAIYNKHSYNSRKTNDNSPIDSKPTIEECVEWKLIVDFAHHHNLGWPDEFLIRCGQNNDWFLMALFAQMYQYPQDVVMKSLSSFSNSCIADHLGKAFQTAHLIRYNKKHLKDLLTVEDENPLVDSGKRSQHSKVIKGIKGSKATGLKLQTSPRRGLAKLKSGLYTRMGISPSSSEPINASITDPIISPDNSSLIRSPHSAKSIYDGDESLDSSVPEANEVSTPEPTTSTSSGSFSYTIDGASNANITPPIDDNSIDSFYLNLAKAPKDLFGLILCCQQNQVIASSGLEGDYERLLHNDQTWKNLLTASVYMSNPILSLIAASVYGSNDESIKFNAFCCYLISLVDNNSLKEKLLSQHDQTTIKMDSNQHQHQNIHRQATASKPRVYDWDEKSSITMLSQLLRTKEQLSNFSLAIRIFTDIQSPLVDLVEFILQFMVEKDYHGKCQMDKLRSFQNNIWQYSERMTTFSMFILNRKNWTEKVSKIITKNSLFMCEDLFELTLILSYYDVSRLQCLFKDNHDIPNINRMYLMCKCLLDAGISFNIEWLLEQDGEHDQFIGDEMVLLKAEHVDLLIDSFHAKGQFDKAREFARYADIPIQNVALKEWLKKAQNGRQEPSFWQSCFDDLRINSDIPTNVIARTFLSISTLQPNSVDTQFVKAWILMKCLENTSVQELDLESHFWSNLIELESSAYVFDSHKSNQMSIIWKYIVSILKSANSVKNFKTRTIAPKPTKMTPDALGRIVDNLSSSDCLSWAIRLLSSLDDLPDEFSHIVMCDALARKNKYHPLVIGTKTTTTASSSPKSSVLRGSQIGSVTLDSLRRQHYTSTSSSSARSTEQSTGDLSDNEHLTSFTGMSLIDDEKANIINEDYKSTVSTIRSHCSIVQFGKKSCERILLYFRISTVLEKSYTQIMEEEDVSVLIKFLIAIATVNNEAATLAKELIASSNMKDEELANFICSELISSIKAHIIKNDCQTSGSQAILGGDSTAHFFSLVRLMKDSSVLGHRLLEHSNGLYNNANQLDLSASTNSIVLSSDDMLMIVQLYIKSHECFTLSCDIQGIAMVLRKTKSLILYLLAPKNQTNLIIKLLTSIGRYSEMTYIFDLLRENNNLDLLLSNNVEKAPQLRVALLNYLKRDKETYPNVALDLRMFRDFADSKETNAMNRLKQIVDISENQTTIKNNLKDILNEFAAAAESYLHAGCYNRANICERYAELIALQLFLLPTGMCVINLKANQVSEFIIRNQKFYESIIVAEAYNNHQSWCQALFNIVILRGDWTYLRDYRQRYELSATVIEEIVIISKQYVSNNRLNQEKRAQLYLSLQKLFSTIVDVELKYTKLAQFNFKESTNKMLEDPAIRAYLKDLRII